MECKIVINHNLTVKEYSWNENESIKYGELYDIINSIAVEFNSVYMFGSVNYNYPIPFSIKHFGFWKSVEKKYDIKINSFNEKKIDLTCYGVFYGFAEVYYSRQVVDFLLDYNRNSWLIFTNKKHDLNFLTDNFIRILSNRIEVSYKKIVDYFCSNDVIVFSFDGSGESGLYIVNPNH